jgi:hypothetical protein
MHSHKRALAYEQISENNTQREISGIVSDIHSEADQHRKISEVFFKVRRDLRTC